MSEKLEVKSSNSLRIVKAKKEKTKKAKPKPKPKAKREKKATGKSPAKKRKRSVSKSPAKKRKKVVSTKPPKPRVVRTAASTALVPGGFLAPHWHEEHKCFKIGNPPLQGAHDTIRKWYAPHYVPPKHQGVGASVSPGIEAVLRGKKVDADIGHWATSVPHLLPSDANEYSHYLVAAFKEWRWTKPVAAQFPVGDLAWRRGTAVDLIVQDPDDKASWILVEIKTGGDNYFETPVGNMLPPLEKVACTAKNLAFLQLALTTILFERTCNHQISTGHVVRVHTKGVNRYKLPPWARKEATKDMVCKMNNP